jgi:hypothetical protein
MDTKTDLVVYPLPPLSGQDRAQVKEMEALAPADPGARIDAALARMGREYADPTEKAAPAPHMAAANPTASPATAASVTPAGAVANAVASETVISEGGSATGEPENPAMTGELEKAVGAPGQSAQSQTADEKPSERRGTPTLYQPGETPASPQKSK